MTRQPNLPKQSSGEFKPMAVAALGIQFAVALVVFGYAGQWIDQRFNTAPFGLLGGVLLGGGGTFYASYRRLMRQQNSSVSTPPRDTP